MKYRFIATETFGEGFYRLPSTQKESARLAWRIFKTDQLTRIWEHTKSIGYRRCAGPCMPR